MASVVLTQRGGQDWREKSRTLGTNGTKETKIRNEKKKEPKVKPLISLQRRQGRNSQGSQRKRRLESISRKHSMAMKAREQLRGRGCGGDWKPLVTWGRVVLWCNSIITC